MPADTLTVRRDPLRLSAIRAALVAAALALVAACTDAGTGASAAPRVAVTRAVAEKPRTPVEVAPGVVVTRAEFGILETDADGTERFVATDDVPAVDGTTFGWVLQVETDRETLQWQEHLRLPKAPADWGDAADDPDVLISKDGRDVAAHGEDPVEEGELQRFYWTLAPGDPAGVYELDVAVEGRAVAHFRFRVPAPVQEQPILVRNRGAERHAGTMPWT
jgi:hypothetical protein